MTRQLGESGPSVFPIGLGGASLSIAGRPAEDDAVAVILRALERGATFIDTARAYCLDEDEAGHNERLIARALAKWDDADDIVVGTKGGVRRPAGRWIRDGTPEHLRASCEASLAALGVDRIDLYQLHAPDPRVPIGESVGVLDELRGEGKIRWIGVSNVDVDQFEEARAAGPILTVQNALSLWDRGAATSGLLAVCESAGVGFLAHSPLGGHPRVGPMDGLDVVEEVAAELGASAQQVALAWLLARSPAIVAIPGTRDIDHVTEDVEAARLDLSRDQAARVGRATSANDVDVNVDVTP